MEEETPSQPSVSYYFKFRFLITQLLKNKCKLIFQTLPFFMSLRNPLTVSSAVHIKGYALENATT